MSTERTAGFVLGFGKPEMSIACLRSLAGQCDPLLYHDNGSEPGVVDRVRAACPDVEIAVAPENQGFALGWNAALARCLGTGADWVLAANNDLEFAPDAVAAMRAAGDARPRAGLVSPKIYYHEQRAQVWSAGLRHRRFPPTIVHRKTRAPEQGEFDREELVEFITLCTVLCRREAVAAAGLLDPSFFFYCEDTDYSARVRAAGYELVYTPAAKVWHKSERIGERRDGEGREFMWRHLGRSEAIFCRKHRGVYPGPLAALHFAYLYGRTLYEGGRAGLRAFRDGVREGRSTELRSVPRWEAS